MNGKLVLVLCAASWAGFWLSQAAGAALEPYRDPALPLEQRVDDLVRRMTLEEKVSQLRGVMAKDLISGGHLSLEACKKLIPNGIGHVSATSTVLTSPQTKVFLADLQNFLRTQTPSGIPAIAHSESITGMAAPGATTYPQVIGMACAWHPELVRANAEATRAASRWMGISQALSPMLDVLDDARWGRCEEGYGEEPYLTSLMGLAFVEGLQGPNLREGVATTAKHFAGYGSHVTDLGLFRDEVLMPHEVVVRQGHAAGVMPGYHAFNGVPCSASKFLLGDVLRKEWGFDGVVTSDYWAIKEVVAKHKYAKDTASADQVCLEAGMDVDLPIGDSYSRIPAAVQSGAIPISLVDTALRRVLTLKFKLGLMDAPKEAGAPAAFDLNPPENRARAYQCACESLVLLKNDGILPLDPGVHSIAVVGPNAASYYSLLGDYTHQMLMEYWDRHPADPASPKLVTLLDGLRDRVDKNVRISYERGCDWTSPLDVIGMAHPEGGDLRARSAPRKPMEAIPKTDTDQALKVAANSDVIIAAMGENRYLCGETRDRQDVRLPGEQEKFVQKLIATGKPVILVVFGGRPMVLTGVAQGCRAIVYAWYPGQEGGYAVADLLLGRFNPSGKLTMTLPRDNRQVPISYRAGYSAEDPPLFPFGHGLAYTTYSYSKLSAPATAKTGDTNIAIHFEVSNTGKREGVEIAQLYFAPVHPAVPERAMELKGFARVALKPGESKAVTINVSPQQFARHDAAGNLTLRPETYNVLVGASSANILLKAKLDLAGNVVTLPHREAFFSRTTVEPVASRD